MISEQLDRYGIEVGGIADEMITYLESSDKKFLDGIVSKPGGVEALLSLDDKELKRSCVILGQGPSQIQKRTDTLRQRDKKALLKLILAAHSLGSMAQESLMHQRGNSMYIGSGYRAVARKIAERLISDREALKKRMRKTIMLYCSADAIRALTLSEKREARQDRLAVIPAADNDLTSVDLSAIKRALDNNLTQASNALTQIYAPETRHQFNRETESYYSSMYDNAQQALKDFEELAIDLDQEGLVSGEGSMEGPDGP